MKSIGRLDFLSNFEPSSIHSIWNRKRMKIFCYHQNSYSNLMLLNLTALHQAYFEVHHETTLLNPLVCHMMASSVPLAVHFFMLSIKRFVNKSKQIFQRKSSVWISNEKAIFHVDWLNFKHNLSTFYAKIHTDLFRLNICYDFQSQKWPMIILPIIGHIRPHIGHFYPWSLLEIFRTYS